jgi:anti-sigma factor RsiW
MTEVQNGGHERWEGDAAAYALDALEESEVRAFEEHLAACTRCQGELAGMRKAVEELPAAQPVAPSPELKQRVMATIRAEAAEQTRPKPTVTAAGRVPRRLRLPGPAWLKPGVVAAGVAAVALVAVVVALTVGNGNSTRTYAGTVYAPGASASLRQSGSGSQLTVSRLPEPPPGRIYQVWLRRAGQALQPTPTLFAVRNGSVPVHGNLRGVRAVLVTAEPRPNGSRTPSRAPIIIVQLT